MKQTLCKKETLWGLSAIVLVWLVLPISKEMGWIRMAPFNFSASIAGALLLYAVGLHFVLVYPMVVFGYPQLWRGTSFMVRVAFVTVLLGLPLFSFTYLIGGDPTLNNLYDQVLIVFPAIILGTLIFESTKKPLLFSLAIFLLTGIPLFIRNEYLSPFSVMQRFFIVDERHYLLRTALCVLAVCLGFYGLSRSESRQERFRNLGYAMLLLCFLSVGVQYLGPALYALRYSLPMTDWVQPQYWWVLNLLCFAVLVGRGALKRSWIRWVSGLQGAYLLYWIASGWTLQQAGPFLYANLGTALGTALLCLRIASLRFSTGT